MAAVIGGTPVEAFSPFFYSPCCGLYNFFLVPKRCIRAAVANVGFNNVENVVAFWYQP